MSEINLLLRKIKLYDISTGIKVQPFEFDPTYADWCNKDFEAQTIIGLNVAEKIALKISKFT